MPDLESAVSTADPRRATPPRPDSSRVVPPPPRGGRLCERRELLESLDESLNTRVTLMVAPAGYGKTTLLAQWCRRLAARQVPVAYYSASERDRDPTMFLGMLAAALAHAGIEASGQPALDRGRVRDDLALEDILLALELAGQPLVLILDDFERLNDPAISDILRGVIDAAPSALHLVVASRTFPSIPLSALELEGKLRLIDTYQLRLRRDELAWMLELDADGSELEEIAARTQGWPVTAELYRLWRRRHRAHDARATFGGHVAEVQNYLTEQLFSSLPAEQLDLLTDIADREEVSADLVDAMRMRDDSARLLAEIARAVSSLMWTGQENGGLVYRLHPLLLEHLRQSLRQDPARRSRLTANAACWFLRRLRYPEAIRAALESDDKEAIERVIGALRALRILVADGATTLRMILRELPDERIADHPHLQLMAAAAHFKAGLFGESRAMIARIRTATRDFSLDPQGKQDALAAEGNLLDLITLCQVSRCGPEIEALQELVKRTAAGDDAIWGACEVVAMLVRQVRGDFAGADEAIRRARDIYATVELSRYSHTQIMGHEALILTARGRLRRAVERIGSYQKAPGFEVPDDLSTPILLRLILAALRYEQDYSDAAVDALRHAFAEHSRSESWLDQYAIAYPVIALRTLLHEGSGPALALIAGARSTAARTEIEALPDFLTFLEVEIRARAGDVEGALQAASGIALDAIAEQRDPLAARRGWRERDAAMQALMRLRLAESRDEAALAAALALAHAGESGGRLRSQVKGRAFAARAAAALGRTEEAEAHLLAAVRLAYPEGFVAPFAEEGEALLPLVEALLSQGALDAYARRHLEEVRRAIIGAFAGTDAHQLNPREREIVGHLANGLSNKLIARRMGITDHTVKFHLKKVFSKLDVSSRRAAVATAIAAGLID